MNLPQMAVFPLVLVRRAIELRAPVKYSEPDLSYVHCGRYPLKGKVYVGKLLMWRHCYIDIHGEHVWPA